MSEITIDTMDGEKLVKAELFGPLAEASAIVEAGRLAEKAGGKFRVFRAIGQVKEVPPDPCYTMTCRSVGYFPAETPSLWARIRGWFHG